MPLQGVFNADFSKFTAACATAEASLKGFETGANETQAALNRMVDSVSGQKIVQQAYLATKAVEDIGGAAVLTEKELARMSSIAAEGVEKLERNLKPVPDDMRALANATKDTATHTSNWGGALQTATGVLGAMGINATIGGVIDFTKEIIKNADAIKTMGDKLGISSEAVQGFKIAAEKGGTTIDAVGAAVLALNRNLATGDKNTIDALDKMGLKFQDVRAMKPEDAFLAVTSAAGDMRDEMDQAKAGADLMGKGFGDMLPAIKAGFADTARAAEKMSDDTTASLARLKTSWDDFANHVSVSTGTVIASLADAAKQSTSSLGNFSQYLLDVIKWGPGFAAALAAGNAQLDRTVAFVGPIEDVSRGTKKTKEELEAAAAAAKKYGDAWAELATVGSSYADTAATVAPKLAEQVSYYLKAGAAIGTVTAAFPELSAAQVTALDEMVKQYEKTKKEILKIEGDHSKAIEANFLGLSKTQNDEEEARIANVGKRADAMIAIEKSLTDEYKKQSMDRTTYENLKVWEAAETQIAAFKKAGHTAEEVTKFSNLLYEDTAIKAAAVYENVTKGSATALQTIWATFDQTLAAGHGTALNVAQSAAQAFDTAVRAAVNTASSAVQDITQDGIDAMNRLIEAQQRVKDLQDKADAEAKAKAQAANTYQGGTKLPGSSYDSSFGQNYLNSPTGAKVPLGPGGTLPKNWEDLYSGRTTFPQFAGGVQNFSGGLAIVGERGPELVNLPGGSDVIPTGGRGGASITNVFHITAPLGTPDAIARAVADAQIGLMRTQGNRLPYGT